MSREINPYSLKDTVYYSLVRMQPTCTCDTCRPRVEALLVSLMNNVDKWMHLSMGANNAQLMDRAATNASNTLNQLRRLHHRPTHHEVIA